MARRERDEWLSHRIRGVHFSFMSDADVRALSVKSITKGQSYDGLGHAVPGGLYDPAMGPSDFGEQCTTCGLDVNACPGHLGHIELSAPVYHPLLVPDLYQVLRCKCFNCHRFRVAPLRARLLAVQLLLLDCGKLSEALDLPTRITPSMGDGEQLEAEEEAQRINTLLTEVESRAVEGKSRAAAERWYRSSVLDDPAAAAAGYAGEPAKQSHSEHVRAARRELIRDFLRVSPPKCASCGCPSVGLRKDGYLKFFRKALPSKARKAVQALGLQLSSAVAQLRDLLRRRREERSGAVALADDGGSDAESVAADEADGDAAAATDGAMLAADAADSLDLGKECFLPPLEVQAHIRLLWEMQGPLCNRIWAPQHTPADRRPSPGWAQFFLRIVPVSPSRFRPPARMNGQRYEAEQNVALQRVMKCSQSLGALLRERRELDAGSGDAAALPADELARRRGEVFGRSMTAWTMLQDAVNGYIDSSRTSERNAPRGLRQILEKKEGLFRMNMMGKRVNFAARSVIAPDPYIRPDQIGVPVRFAKVLCYPQPVTSTNFKQLGELVRAGPNQYPGANYLEMEDGHLCDLSTRSEAQRQALANTLLAPSTNLSKDVLMPPPARGAGNVGMEMAVPFRPKRVWRHLLDGDVVLMNRQPTLHKPSIMAHRARVMTYSADWQTIRMHYANCKTFNADFDGDEMNMHFPQDELSRAESYFIANTANQYIVPTSGEPIRGLIQDHIDVAVLLTQRGMLLNRREYHQLVWNALCALPEFETDPSRRLPLMPPAILKPEPMWTGKQVISSLLTALAEAHQGRGGAGVNFDGKAKIKTSHWTPVGHKTPPDHEVEEHVVRVRGSRLVTGVLDKASLGAAGNGLVHGLYEVLGPQAASSMLSAVGRLLTEYLKTMGVTCGIDDLVLTSQGDAERRRLVDKAYALGASAAAGHAQGKEEEGEGRQGGESKTAEAAPALDLSRDVAVRAALGRKLRGSEGTPVELEAMLDNAVKGAVGPAHGAIIEAVLPSGLQKAFPENMFSLIVQSGAKGSQVNHAMIACGLGQQELEGRRVPRMQSGKTLPSFPAFDPHPRSGGYVADRFLTGLRPQEYYFHCMSGREGLVDTAVKTSRSGYLQRCLVKHLEDLRVAYDHTVRDSEGSIYQFLYGEDGLDVVQASLLSGSKTSMSLLQSNAETLATRFGTDQDTLHRARINATTPALRQERITAQQLAFARVQGCSLTASTPVADAARGGEPLGCGLSAGDWVDFRRPLRSGEAYTPGNISQSWWRARVIKTRRAKRASVGAGEGNKKKGKRLAPTYDIEFHPAEGEDVTIDWHNAGEHTVLVKRVPSFVPGAGFVLRPVVDDPVTATTPVPGHLGVVGETLHAKLAVEDGSTVLAAFGKAAAAAAAPGEPVGTLAAQSVGEPSTQMTLNTFHLAGHGGVNVTLGIPRLREIVMTASQDIKTPAMTIPTLPEPEDAGAAQRRAKRLYTRMMRVPLADLIDCTRDDGGIRVTQRVRRRVAGMGSFSDWVREYRVRLVLAPATLMKKAFNLEFADVATAAARTFVAQLLAVLAKELRKAAAAGDAAATRVARVTGDSARVALDAQKEDADDTTGLQAVDAEEQQEEERVAVKKKRSEDDEDGVEADSGDEDEDEDDGDGASEEEENAEDSGAEDEAKATPAGGSPAGGADSSAEESDGKESGDESVAAAAEDGMAGASAGAGVEKFPVPGAVSGSDRFVAFTGNPKAGWIEATLQFPVSTRQLLIMDAVEQAMRVSVIRQTRKIERCVVTTTRLEEGAPAVPVVQTEGVNLTAVWAAADACGVDVNRLRTNDIGAILRTYGVEAARAAVVREVKGVFAVYGIGVDPRHLSLIADYMTHTGGYRAMNRLGMQDSGSPFLQMSFETTARFLVDAAKHRKAEVGDSPSARIVLGRVSSTGTGAFELRHPVPEDDAEETAKGAVPLTGGVVCR